MFDTMNKRYPPITTAEEISFGENEHSTLFILGNGFDLNLKLPTSYKDFFESDFFPFVRDAPDNHGLGRFIYGRGVVQKWYDLEHLLAEYGKSIHSLSEKEFEEDKNDYRRLVEGLTLYLSTIDYSTIDVDSIAARILKAADGLLIPPRVYTFNYTAFDTISSRLGISFGTASHVHGSLEQDNVVLGVGEYVKLGPLTSYLYKTSNINYDPGSFLTAIENYDTVIIFGLSLSQVDYPYFEDFFKAIATKPIINTTKPYIRIFSYDERSRMAILDNLRQMNSGLIKLKGYSDFDIIRTKDGMDAYKVDAVIQRLSSQWEVDA